MTQTVPPSITPSPVAPDRADRATFSPRATAWADWVKNHAVAEIAAVATNVYNNAVDAFNSATTALGSANAASDSAAAAAISESAAASDAANTAVLLANAGSMLGINFGAFTMVDNELIVTHLTTATPSIVNGDLILDYETL